MNESEAYMKSISNTFTKEPVFNCPQCNAELHTDWVDNGFGPYSVQASPYGCECGWHETGCNECIKEKCFSWVKCQGKAVKPAVQDSVIINMNSNYIDPKEGQEEVKDQPAEQVGDQAAEVTESAEEGGTEG